MIKVLIDSDVILDLLPDREPFGEQSERVFESLTTEHIQGYVTVAALLNIYYIARKTLGRNAALDCVRRLLETDGLEVFAVDKRHVRIALNSAMTDFEDAVQAAVAEISELDFIVTRDKRDFRLSSVPGVLPEEFFENLENWRH